MKKLRKFLGIILVGSLLVACSGGKVKANQPQGVADKFLTAFENYDITEMNKYLVAEDQLDADFFTDEMDEVEDLEFVQALWGLFFKKSHKILKEEVSGDKAVVTVAIDVLDFSSAYQIMISAFLTMTLSGDVDFDSLSDEDALKMLVDVFTDSVKDSHYKTVEAPLHLIKVGKDWKIDSMTPEGSDNNLFFEAIFEGFDDFDLFD